MKNGIQNGKYILGELIEPKKFKKIIIGKDGKVQEMDYTVCGRKIPLNIIRQQIFEKHFKLGLIRPSEENTIHRHLLVWADHASVLNTGHLLFTIRVIFTPKVFYTDSEMLASTGIVHDVQEIVETPAIYILGQTTDSLSEKLSYTETRLRRHKKFNPSND